MSQVATSGRPTTRLSSRADPSLQVMPDTAVRSAAAHMETLLTLPRVQLTSRRKGNGYKDIHELCC